MLKFELRNHDIYHFNYYEDFMIMESFKFTTFIQKKKSSLYSCRNFTATKLFTG